MAPRIAPNARMIVENRPGAGGSLGAEYVARQNFDGHLSSPSPPPPATASTAALPDTVRYDAVNDFSHLAIIGGGPMVIVVPGSSAYRTVAELVAAAKLAPAPLLWGSSGSGGIAIWTGSLFCASQRLPRRICPLSRRFGRWRPCARPRSISRPRSWPPPYASAGRFLPPAGGDGNDAPPATARCRP